MATGDKRRDWRLLYSVCASFLLMVLYLTTSRGAFLTGAIGLGALVLLGTTWLEGTRPSCAVLIRQRRSGGTHRTQSCNLGDGGTQRRQRCGAGRLCHRPLVTSPMTRAST